MEHLSTVDAGFLEAEDADPHVSLAIGAVAVLAGPMPDFDTLVDVLADRLTTLPRFRQVLRQQPLDLAAPRWVDQSDVDIAHHVRRVAVPRPGDDEALFTLVADIMSRRLDRDRPLWECWIVEGLACHRWAIVVKIHHCMADGIAATRMLTRLCDGAEHVTFAPPREADEKHSATTNLLNPMTWIANAWRTSAGVGAAAAQTLQGAADLVGGLVGGLLRPSSAPSLTGPITSMRRYASVEVSLDDVHRICDEFDVTINDVALAAITDSFRKVLLGRGERPSRNAVRTLVPVSVRAADAADVAGNQVSVMLTYLPVEKPDPIAQLRAVHHRLTRTKGSGQRQAGSVFVSAANAIPFALTAAVVRALSRLPQHSIGALATNVPGPRQRLRVLDREVVRLLPIPPLALGLRTGIAMLTYADHLAFGINADYDAVPDLDALAANIEQSVSRMAAISAVPHRSTRLGTLALVQCS